MSEVMTLDVSAFEESAAWVKAQKMGSNYFHIKTTRTRLLPPNTLMFHRTRRSRGKYSDSSSYQNHIITESLLNSVVRALRLRRNTHW